MMRGCGRNARWLAVCGVWLAGLPGAAVGQIVINEIMQNPAAVGDSSGEWFELYNGGSSAVDINGWKIKDDATASETHTIDSTGGLSISAGGYLVLGLNSDTTSNGGVTVDYVYSRISLGNGTDGLVLTDGSDVEQDSVKWDNGSTFPDPNGASMALRSPSLDNSVGGNWCTSPNDWTGGTDSGTPGAANDCPPRTFTGAIYAIQGEGAASPYVGFNATTAGNVITALDSSGFFMQTPTASSDGNADTSDGIYVHLGAAPGDSNLAVGDVVTVVGLVEDGPASPAYGMTRLNASSGAGGSVTETGTGAVPDPVEFDAARPSPDPTQPSCAIEYECYEGMRVRVAKGTVSSPNQYFGSSSNLEEMFVTATTSRAYREPGIAFPGIEGLPVWDGNPELFELDPDRLGLDNQVWVPGTTFTATGILGYEFSGYELWATSRSVIGETATLPRAVRARRSGEITVGSLNVLSSSFGSATRRQKLSGYIRDVLGAPDILGLQEVPSKSELEALATRIRTDDPTISYSVTLPATSGSQRLALLTRAGITVRSAREYGAGETFVDPDDRVITLHDRPPLVADVSVGDLSFTVVVIHSRSLIDIETSAFARAKRLEQAQSLARLAESLQGSKLIIVGDYNAFEFSDGYVDVIGQMRGWVDPSESLLSGPDLVSRDLCVLTERAPSADRYSYIFGGSAQTLDHALVNQSLERHVVGIEYGRGNTDAPRDERFDATNILNASDHDGFVVYLSSTPKDPVERSPCQQPPPALSDLAISAASDLVDGNTLRYLVRVRNAGPADALDVKVQSSLSSAASVTSSTLRCAEDPNGVPTCSLGTIEVGEQKAFFINVKTSQASELPISYRGEVTSRYPDPVGGNDIVDLAAPLGRPMAPTRLVAEAISETEVKLVWQDNSNVETGFAVFLQGPGDSRLRQIGVAPADATSMTVVDLVPSITYNFAVEARNGDLPSARSNVAAATTWTADTARCAAEDVVCLGRFQVEIDWDAGDGGSGRAVGERLTADSADFWFFHPDNIDMVIKVLDGCWYNGHHWVMATGLTDVGVTTTVRNLRDGSERTWTNERGNAFEPVFDTAAFACEEVEKDSVGAGASLSGFPGGQVGRLYRESLERSGQASAPLAAACKADDGALCLQQGRYEVRARFSAGDVDGAAGSLARTVDSGMFWFFAPENVELVAKVLDGCAVNGHRWVLLGGLTDVGVEVTVSDSLSDATKTYANAEGSLFPSMFDTTAFACEPD